MFIILCPPTFVVFPNPLHPLMNIPFDIQALIPLSLLSLLSEKIFKMFQGLFKENLISDIQVCYSCSNIQENLFQSSKPPILQDFSINFQWKINLSESHFFVENFQSCLTIQQKNRRILIFLQKSSIHLFEVVFSSSLKK